VKVDGKVNVGIVDVSRPGVIFCVGKLDFNIKKYVFLTTIRTGQCIMRLYSCEMVAVQYQEWRQYIAYERNRINGMTCGDVCGNG
jgi:hypothetical protein